MRIKNERLLTYSSKKISKKRIFQIKILKTLHIKVQASSVASFIVAFLLRNKMEFKWIISSRKRAEEHDWHA